MLSNLLKTLNTSSWFFFKVCVCGREGEYTAGKTWSKLPDQDSWRNTVHFNPLLVVEGKGDYDFFHLFPPCPAALPLCSEIPTVAKSLLWGDRVNGAESLLLQSSGRGSWNPWSLRGQELGLLSVTCTHSATTYLCNTRVHACVMLEFTREISARIWDGVRGWKGGWNHPHIHQLLLLSLLIMAVLLPVATIFPPPENPRILWCSVVLIGLLGKMSARMEECHWQEG